MPMEISKLLQEEESEYLDFKEEYHSNKAKLLHDILCLANSDTEKDKYIIFGVSDDKHIIGISDNLKNHNIVDFLKATNINKPLYNNIKLYKINKETKDGSTVTIYALCIKNSLDKPFFLTKDYFDKKVVVRAGVTYTRNGDTNTALNSTASSSEIEKMYNREISPKEKAFIFIKEPNDWEYNKDYNDIYYKKDFDYNITRKLVPYNNIAEQKKINKYISGCCSIRYIVKIFLKYKKINILECELLVLGNYRRIIPYPSCEAKEGSYYIKNDHNMDVCQIIQRHLSWPNKESSGFVINYDVIDTIKEKTKFEIKNEEQT